MNSNEIRNLLAYSEIMQGQLNSARKAKLWVAALVLGCSLAECLLLMRAISSIDRIREMPKYRDVTMEELCSNKWGLRKLSKLALDSGWFDSKHIDRLLRDALMVEIRKQVPKDKHSDLNIDRGIPVIMLQLATVQRNSIHAGRVAGRIDSPARSRLLGEAEAGCTLLEFVLRCLRETQNEKAMG
jgi:hypothetical protein